MDRAYSEGISMANEMEEKCKLTSKSSDNNNDEEYKSSYTVEDRLIVDRESALSSSDSDDESNSINNSSTPQSGRSSADQSDSDDIKALNTISNMMPESEGARELVDMVRSKFLDIIQDEGDSFDPLDLSELEKPLPAVKEHEQSLAFRLISRYIDFNRLLGEQSADKKETELNTAVESLVELLKFRHHYRLSETKPESFSQEFYILNGIFQFGHDKNGLPILYLRARVHRRWSPRLDEAFRRYVAWHIDQITKSNHGARVNKQAGRSPIEKDGSFGICFDCIHLSYSCLDMDFLRFLVNILVQHYPTYCRYALCVDLPWLFRSVWRLVRSWLPEEARDTLQLITAKQLLDYIDESQIPNSIKINDSKTSVSNGRKHRFPKNYADIKNIDGLANELNLGSSEVKQLKAHVEKIRKEYEQLGAI